MRKLDETEKEAIAKGLMGGKELFEQLAGMFEDASDAFNSNPDHLAQKDLDDIEDALFKAFHVSKGMLHTLKGLLKQKK